MKALTESLEIIDDTKNGRDDYGHSYGSEDIVLGAEHIQAILAGKVVAFSDGEYTHFLQIDGADK